MTSSVDDTVPATNAALISSVIRGNFVTIKSEISALQLKPSGEVYYFNTTGTAVTISAQSDGSTNMVVIPVVTSGNYPTETDNGGANAGRLRYTGSITKVFNCIATISTKPTTANDTVVLAIAKNGTAVIASKVLKTLRATTDTETIILNALISLATNDYLEVYVGNTTAGNNITVLSLNLTAVNA